MNKRFLNLDKVKTISVISAIAALSKKAKITILSVAGIIVLGGIVLCIALLNRKEVIYVESIAEIGNLTVGITESGNITVEEEEQTFDIDINEFSSNNNDAFAWESGGGMGNMGMDMFSTTLGETQSSNTRELIVEEVLVSEGEEITAGTPICSFSEESLTVIRNGLADDEAAAKTTLQERKTDLELNRLSAKQELEQNQLYGELAQQEYDSSIKELKDKRNETQENLEELQSALEEDKAELAEKQTELEAAAKVLENAEYIVENMEVRTQLYYWIEAENNRYQANTTVTSLTSEIEALEKNIENAESQITTLNLTLSNANKEYETGKIEAQAVYDNRILKYEAAQEIYDTAIASSQLSYEIAADEYADAKERLDDFNAVIEGNYLIASSNGVISAVSIEAGDRVYQNSSIITYNAYEDVSITITLEEGDRNKIEVGNAANVLVNALEDEMFSGKVSEIGDAVYDNDSGVNTYEVTIELTGALEKIYDGMSAEVTLVTKEKKEVLYIPNRAIIQQGGKSYVKIKNASGKTEKIWVETGFSDGVNVEILEGLSEGDIVLLESKVSDS